MASNQRFFTPLGIAATVFAVPAILGFGNDVIRLIGAGAWSPLSLGEFWASIDFASLNLLQAVIQRYLHPDLWWNVVEPTLHWPTWVMPLAIAGFLAVFKWRPWQNAR
jgi:hypothetical protein